MPSLWLVVIAVVAVVVAVNLAFILPGVRQFIRGRQGPRDRD